ncbi:MAG: hypothetical protein GC178_10585 [Flavobacteriales bacterium]|nr:hypothetical protein [Flavobacteriales bacterium]
MKTQVRRLTFILAAAFGAIAFSQCGQRAEEGKTAQKDADQEEQTVIEEMFAAGESETDEDKRVTQKDVNNEFKEAFQAATEHVDQQLDELAQHQAIKRMERTADKLDKKITELQARLDERKLTADAKDEMRELKSLQKDLDRQLEDVQDATADQWDDVKKDTKDAYRKSEAAIKQEVNKVEDLLADSK